MKYGLVGLILIAVLCAGGIYYYQHQHKYFNVYDAQVTSSLVAAKVHGNAMITEKVVEEGEHVEAGDVIAHKRFDLLISENSFCLTFINSGSRYVNVVESGNSFYNLSLHILIHYDSGVNW